MICNLSNPATAKLRKITFHPLEVVSRYRDPQREVDENYITVKKTKQNKIEHNGTERNGIEKSKTKQKLNRTYQQLL